MAWVEHCARANSEFWCPVRFAELLKLRSYLSLQPALFCGEDTRWERERELIYQNTSIIFLRKLTLVYSTSAVTTAASLYGKASLLGTNYTLMNGWGSTRVAAPQKYLLITGLLSDACTELAVGEVLQWQRRGSDSLLWGSGGTCCSGARWVQLCSQWDTQPDSIHQVLFPLCLIS